MSSGSVVDSVVECKNLVISNTTGKVINTIITYQTNTTDWSFPSPAGVKRPSARPMPWTSGLIIKTQYDSNTSYTRDRGPLGTYKGTSVHCWPSEHTGSSTDSQGDALRDLVSARAAMGAGPVNLATSLGDVDKTAKMIAKRIRQLSEAAKRLRNGQLDEFAKLLGIHLSRSQRGKIRDTPFQDRISDHWLEFIYGWKPLVQDVYGGFEAIHKGFQKEGTRINAFRGKKPNPSSTPVPGLPKGSPFHGAYVGGNVNNPQLRTLQELGLLNPALLAWELLPYSFVVDWFLPVGDVLAGLTAGVGMSNVTSGITWETRQTDSYHGYPYKVWSHIFRSPVVGGAVAYPIQLLHWEPSITRVTSAVALLQQKFRR